MGVGVAGTVVGTAGIDVGVGVAGTVVGAAGIDVGVGVAGTIDGAAGVDGGNGVGTDAETLSLTTSWIGVPPAGVIVTAVLYTPGCKPVASAVNVSVEDVPGASLLLVGLTCSQGASAGTLAVHVTGSAPGLVTTTNCEVEAVPLVARKERWVLLTCIVLLTGGGGDVTWIVIGIVAGLPGIAAAVSGSIALTTTVVVYVVPSARPVASTVTLTSTLAPPARMLLGLAERLTKGGASEASVACHFSDVLPVFEMANDLLVTPPVTLKTSELGPTEKVV